jgi:hypothetical protein
LRFGDLGVLRLGLGVGLLIITFFETTRGWLGVGVGVGVRVAEVRLGVGFALGTSLWPGSQTPAH